MAQPQRNLIPRTIAGLYDWTLIFALMLLVSMIGIAINHGEAIESTQPYFLIYQVSILLVPQLYFIYFFQRHGQTLGMRVWKLKLQTNQTHTRPSLAQSFWRFPLQILTLGLGSLWILFSRQGQSLCDQLLKLEVISTKQEKT